MTYMIVGLGNPGSEYENTRHNAGFHAVNALGDELGARYWKNQGGALVAVVMHGDKEIVLVKPQSFMNASGGPVKAVAAEYAVSPENVIVIHDELDLDPGTVKVKRDGGHAGHNGLKSIHAKLNTDAYPRVRVGIGRPQGRMPMPDYVLATLRGDALEDFKVDCAKAAEISLAIVDDGVTAAMNRYNVKVG